MKWNEMKWMNEWNEMNERMSEWMNEGMNEMNEWMNEMVTEGSSDLGKWWLREVVREVVAEGSGQRETLCFSV